jgi:hypothetical protein
VHIEETFHIPASHRGRPSPLSLVQPPRAHRPPPPPPLLLYRSNCGLSSLRRDDPYSFISPSLHRPPATPTPLKPQANTPHHDGVNAAAANPLDPISYGGLTPPRPFLGAAGMIPACPDSQGSHSLPGGVTRLVTHMEHTGRHQQNRFLVAVTPGCHRVVTPGSHSIGYVPWTHTGCRHLNLCVL